MIYFLYCGKVLPFENWIVMGKNKKKQTYPLSVVDFSPQGHGLAYLENKEGSLTPVEIKHSVPGDEANVQLLRKKKKILQTWVEEFTKLSKDRIPSKCSHFSSCGGCKWQQVPYATQLKIKEERLLKLYQELNPKWLGLTPCDSPWPYRNKMEFTFSQNKAGEHFLGLHMTAGRVLNLEECAISPSWFTKALETIRTWWHSTSLTAFHPPQGTGSLRTVTLREGVHTGEKMILLTVSGHSDYALSQNDLNSFCSSLKNEFGNDICIYLQIHQAIKGQPTQFYEMHLNGPEWIHEQLTVIGKTHTFAISPTAFFQPNTKQAEKLYTQAIEGLNLNQKDILLDLYCGTGTIGILASSQCKQVVGIELVPQAVLDAKDNIDKNNIGNMKVFQGDAADPIPLNCHPTCAIIDPPRAGLGSKAIENIKKFNLQKIAYISCNPNTQVEDVKELQKQGFTLQSLQAVDQFPYTPHLETIAILEKL